jgi:alkanesulfonate monooxygenase SsuD/methylene tetrahydromethanopterin reductase-like flavin-dependent oxidoreductase (luciferase family)
MEFGLYLRSFMADPSRPLFQQIDEVVEICHVARDAGFSAVSVPQHWISHPTVWPQPFPLLARLAPETGDMRLLAGIVLLPLHNPVDIAETAVTLDHISKGRFILGVGLGYRDAELEAAGATRQDRVPRMTESLELMKRLWSGEEVTFEGRYWKVHHARMGVRPVQQPHPPIWMACQSRGAVQRAARLADACYLAPQVGFQDLKLLADFYRTARTEAGKAGPGKVAISRGVSLARSRQTAVQEAQKAAEASYRMYRTWEMQEEAMVRIHISTESELTDWAVVGSADECLEGFARLHEEAGVEFVGLTLLNLPKDHALRKEYLQEFSQKVIRRMK